MDTLKSLTDSILVVEVKDYTVEFSMESLLVHGTLQSKVCRE